MWRADPEANGIPYRDAGGRVFDFHAIRHLFISNLAAAGVHPKVAQTLARHSTITLTMDRYTHLGLHDQTAALDKLPQLPSKGPQAGRLAATGTDGAHSPAGEFSCVRLITGETGDGPEGRKGDCQETPEMKAFAVDCDRLRTCEIEEAPPGFEPGMADLQSAALPLG